MDETEREIRDYLCANGVTEMVEEMIKAVVVERPSNPSAFCIDFLKSLEVSQKASAISHSSGGKSKVAFNRMHKINWQEIADALPTGRDPEQKAKREKTFYLFDVNGNHYLSLAEVDKGLRDISKLPSMFDAKPALIRAFQAAKNVNKTSKARLGEDFITKSEFRALLVFLKKYFELFVMFDKMDQDDDRRLNLEEFKNAAKLVESWGIKTFYPDQAFKSIDRNNGGIILFDEFAQWAIEKHLQLEEVDADEEDFSVIYSSGPGAAGQSNLSTNWNKPAGGGRKKCAAPGVGGGASNDAPAIVSPSLEWIKLATNIPASNSRLNESKRDELFGMFDVNRANALSYSDLEQAVSALLQDDRFPLKASVARAVAATKGPVSGGLNFSKADFRMVLLYLHRYMELCAMFERVLGEDERPVTYAEFQNSIGKLMAWGLKMSDPSAEFNRIDKKRSGSILFDSDFCDWAILCKGNLATADE